MVTWEERLVPLTCHRRDGVGAHTEIILPKSRSSTDAVMGTGIASVRYVERIITSDGEKNDESQCPERVDSKPSRD